MTADLNILRDLIADDALVPATSDQHGNRILVLEEPDPQAKYSLRIQRVPDDVLAIRSDRFPKPKFKGTLGERKRADFIVVAVAEKKKWIVYIELKSGMKSGAEMRQQLNGAKCLLAYCRAIGRTFWQQTYFLDETEYHQRFVSVARMSMNKKPTRHRRTPAVH